MLEFLSMVKLFKLQKPMKNKTGFRVVKSVRGAIHVQQRCLESCSLLTNARPILSYTVNKNDTTKIKPSGSPSSHISKKYFKADMVDKRKWKTLLEGWCFFQLFFFSLYFLTHFCFKICHLCICQTHFQQSTLILKFISCVLDHTKALLNRNQL